MKQVYAANVEVYGETIFVDTATGEGVDKVLKKIDPLLCGHASRSYLQGHTFEDVKQELSIIAIEGINAFNPNNGVKMSTFLQTHIRNKLISKLRSENKMSNDAFSLDIVDPENRDRKIQRAREEFSFSQCTPVNHDNEAVPFEFTVGEDDGIFGDKSIKSGSIDFSVSLMKLLDKMDKDTAKIIKLVYFHDYTIKDAAEEVGMSSWAASIRLKSLAGRRSFKDIFEQND